MTHPQTILFFTSNELHFGQHLSDIVKRALYIKFLFYPTGAAGHSISGAVDVSTRFSNTRYFFQASTTSTTRCRIQ